MRKLYQSLSQARAGCRFKPTLEMYCRANNETPEQLLQRSSGASYANVDFTTQGHFNGRYDERMWVDLITQNYKHNVLQILGEKRDVQKFSGRGKIANWTTDLGRRKNPDLGYQGVITAVLYPGESLQKGDFAVERRNNGNGTLVGTTGAAFTFTFNEVKQFMDTMRGIYALRDQDKGAVVEEFNPFGNVRYNGIKFNLFREFGVNQDNCIVDLIKLRSQD